MEYIAAAIGETIYYIEKDRILTIIEKPDVYEVPDAGSKIAGISVYEDKLVVYFKMGENDSSGCGIVVDTQSGILQGMTAESVWVQEMDSELLQSVMPGVWVVSDDKTD